MKNSFSSRTTIGIIALVLLILFAVSIILMLVFGIISKTSFIDGAYSFCLNLSVTIVGLIITAVIIQKLIDSRNDKNKRQAESKKIVRYNRIMELFLSQYKKHFNMVVSPIDEKNISFNNLKDDFEFEDLHSLHAPSFIEGDPFFHYSRIKLFYKSEKDVVDFAKKMVEEIDFAYNDDLLKTINGIVECSIVLDVKECILGNETLKTSEDNKTLAALASQYIKEDKKHNWIKFCQSKDRYANLMGPYVKLFQLLKEESNHIKAYEAIIKRISSNIEP